MNDEIREAFSDLYREMPLAYQRDENISSMDPTLSNDEKDLIFQDISKIQSLRRRS